MLLASRSYCEEFYALTNCGHKFEIDFYYDPVGNILTKDQVKQRSGRTLSIEFTPAYDSPFVRELIKAKSKHPERMKSKLKTALYLGEDETLKLAIQWWQQDYIKK